MSDIWRDVRGYEGRYQVSSTGFVRSLNTTTLTTTGQTRIYKGRILATTVNSVGYSVVNLRSNNTTKQFKIHRLVAAAFLPYDASRTFVNHIDLNKTNNNSSNLEYVTTRENLEHAFKNGVRVGKTVLNVEQRKEIRKLRSQGLTLKEIAKQFNVSGSAVSEVARGTTWAWETKNEEIGY